MDDLIGRVVANAGVDRTAAKQAVAFIPQFPPEARTQGNDAVGEIVGTVPELGHFV
ncbi:MAG TPA: hypothetical protein VH397_13715 [Xanthobacteraceae bacterium]|jgi:hypothetical protein